MKILKRIKSIANKLLDLYIRLRRKKTLNYLLWVSIVLIAREGTSIGGGNSSFFLGVLNAIENPEWWQNIGLTLLSIICYKGSYIMLGVYLLIFILLVILKWRHQWIVGLQNSNLNDFLQDRVRKLEAEGEQAAENRRLLEAGFENEKQRLMQSLKRSGISTQRLIQKYDKPLKAILISYMTQKVNGPNGHVIKEKYAQREFLAQGAVSLGGSELIIPPTKFPKSVKTREDMQKWFEQKILKGRYLKLKFMAIVDLREKLYWSNNVPEEPESRRAWHHTIGEALNIDELFSEENIKRIALSDIVKDGDIVWLASSGVSSVELHWLQHNQIRIENVLGNPNLRKLAKGDLKNSIVELLQESFNEDDAAAISNTIITEAKYWQEKLS